MSANEMLCLSVESLASKLARATFPIQRSSIAKRGEMRSRWIPAAQMQRAIFDLVMHGDVEDVRRISVTVL